jgi:hypothetical protein
MYLEPLVKNERTEKVFFEVVVKGHAVLGQGILCGMPNESLRTP